MTAARLKNGMEHTVAIRAQIAELEAEVRKDPRFVALDHLRMALSALEGGMKDGRDSSILQPDIDMPRQGGSKKPPQIWTGSGPREDSKIKRTHSAVGQFIDAHGPSHRAILVQALTDAGLMDGIKNPLTSFSTSMHTLRDYFVSDGHGTFRRREGAPTDVIPTWSKKGEGESLPTSSPQGETEGWTPSASEPAEHGKTIGGTEERPEAGGI